MSQKGKISVWAPDTKKLVGCKEMSGIGTILVPHQFEPLFLIVG